MCLKDGNLGIGTTSPAAKLEVNGTSTSHTNNTPTNPSCLIYGDYGGEILWIGHPNQTQGIQLGYNTIKKWSTDDGATNDSLYFNISGSTDMIINASGDVGIGANDPQDHLHINKAWACMTLQGTADDQYAYTRYQQNHYSTGPSFYVGVRANECFVSSQNNYRLVFNTNNTERMRITEDGKIGIGTPNPISPLHINGSDATTTSSSYQAYWHSGHTTTSAGSAYDISLYVSHVIWAGSGGFIASSDQRIKTNIREVPDNLSLQTLRDISCCYYEYKDKVTRGSSNTIGFIAQQVKEHMPLAVSIKKKFIPNEMRKLTNITWNDTILTTDLQNVSGIKYRFYVSNDISGNDEIQKEIIGNSDNTFTFDTSYNNVFCYGKEVDDFHTLDKNKLFALNFSATQELDKQQQADKTEIQHLKQLVYDTTLLHRIKFDKLNTEISTLKSELSAIKQHLGI